MAIGIANDFLGNFAVLSSAVIFLCAATVGVVAGESDGKYLLAIGDYEIDSRSGFG